MLIHQTESIIGLRLITTVSDSNSTKINLTGTLVKRKNVGQIFPVGMTRNSKKFTSLLDIAEQFNQHFINVGHNLAKAIYIHITAGDPCGLDHSPLHSFFVSSDRRVGC